MTVRLHRFLGVLASALILAVLVTGALAWKRYDGFLATPLGAEAPSAAFELRVQPGDSVRAVLAKLDRRGLTRNDWRWRLLLWQEPVTIQVGEYEIPIGTGPREFLQRLARGDVIQYRFTIVEGWNWWQLRDALLADERLAVPRDQLDRATVMATLGSERDDPEGWFLPETYAYIGSDDAFDVLERAHDAMEQALADAWDTREDGLPIDTPTALLTLASIVEKESSVSAERPRIAGVFVRRLEQKWRLETDPTVIYGIGEHFDGDIRSRDLRADTPYNTYVHRGLPPTPIAMPGNDSLKATAAPAKGSAMFFVADGKGGHVFSETLDEHNAAVRAMLRRQASEPKSDGAPSPDGEGQSG